MGEKGRGEGLRGRGEGRRGKSATCGSARRKQKGRPRRPNYTTHEPRIVRPPKGWKKAREADRRGQGGGGIVRPGPQGAAPGQSNAKENTKRVEFDYV